jgi:hypothetical protein
MLRVRFRVVHFDQKALVLHLFSVVTSWKLFHSFPKEKMSCPVVNKPKDGQEAALTAYGGNESAEKEFQSYTSTKVRDLFNGLRRQTLEIEANIAIGEREVLDRDQHAYMMRRHELSIAYLQAAHAVDLQKQKDALEAILVARSERKKAKKEGRKSIRASKRRDQTIQQQKKSADAAARIRESISEKRAAFDSLTQHMVVSAF